MYINDLFCSVIKRTVVSAQIKSYPLPHPLEHLLSSSYLNENWVSSNSIIWAKIAYHFLHFLTDCYFYLRTTSAPLIFMIYLHCP